MEAKDFACAEAPDALPFVAAAEGVGCVKHELQPMVVGDGLEFVNRRSTAPEVHADNPGGTRSDHAPHGIRIERSEEHTSELQSLMRISYAVFCLKKKTNNKML